MNSLLTFFALMRAIFRSDLEKPKYQIEKADGKVEIHLYENILIA